MDADLKISVLIPARNEEGSILETIEGAVTVLQREGIDYEILVVDDGSTDPDQEPGRRKSGCRPAYPLPSVAPPARIRNGGQGGARRVHRGRGRDPDGRSVRRSGRPRACTTTSSREGWDCAFGSRFMPGAALVDYPRLKLLINRMANRFVASIFRLGYNDTTNAFKAYRREVIETVSPLLSKHFNLTVELPLKAVTRGHSFKVVPTSLAKPDLRQAKLAMQEMGSRYLFIVLYIWLEYHLSRGDYRKPSGFGC